MGFSAFIPMMVVTSWSVPARLSGFGRRGRGRRVLVAYLLTDLSRDLDAFNELIGGCCGGDCRRRWRFDGRASGSSCRSCPCPFFISGIVYPFAGWNVGRELRIENIDFDGVQLLFIPFACVLHVEVQAVASAAVIVLDLVFIDGGVVDLDEFVLTAAGPVDDRVKTIDFDLRSGSPVSIGDRSHAVKEVHLLPGRVSPAFGLGGGLWRRFGLRFRGCCFHRRRFCRGGLVEWGRGLVLFSYRLQFGLSGRLFGHQIAPFFKYFGHVSSKNWVPVGCAAGIAYTILHSTHVHLQSLAGCVNISPEMASTRTFTDAEAARELQRNPGVRQASPDPTEATAETVLYMCELIQDSLVDGIVQQATKDADRFRQFAASPWASIWWWAKHHIVFVHHQKLLVAWLGAPDELQLLIRPDALLKMTQPKGDCAVFTTLICAMLDCAGLDWEICTVAVDPRQPGIYSHVYPRVILQNGRRIPLDASHGKFPGWEVPAQHVLGETDLEQRRGTHRRSCPQV